MRSVGKLVPRANRGGSGQLPGEKPGSDARGDIPSDPGAPKYRDHTGLSRRGHEQRVGKGRIATVHDVREPIMEGAVQRVRPKMMTVAATGAGVMKRITAPMIDGIRSGCSMSGLRGAMPARQSTRS
ncbi:MAG: hypothetical protein ABI988_04265 [Nitrospirota bacterium]